MTPGDLAALRRLPRADWTERFSVVTAESDGVSDRPPVLGSYEIEGDRLRFTPDYPWVPGQSYVARWAGAAPVELRWTAASRDPAQATEVIAVFPSANELPENLLKFYVQFSATMSRDEARRHIALLDESGESIPVPWVAPELELWNSNVDRLTLFFDPGRIKRGVGPNAERGPPLLEGRSYRLVIDSGWHDGRGQPLTGPFEKTFRVIRADRRSPDPTAWQVYPPTEARADLTVAFDEPLDRALLDRMIRIVDAKERAVDGQARIAGGEQSWSYRAAGGWSAGHYSVLVDGRLTDLAGNSLYRRFEMPQGETRQEPTTVRLQFEIPSRF